MSFLEQKGMLAKLLATENIIVQYDPQADTASFNTSTRILTVPMYEVENENVLNMMLGHEVSHALFTPTDWSEQIPDDVPFDYVNVIEDVRIEKMIQDKYPGLRRDFSRGYDYLNEKDFFSIGDRDINSFNFIDRINLHFKLGSRALVKFSEQEMDYIRAIDEADTFEKVLLVSALLSDYVKSKPQNQQDFEEQEDGETQNVQRDPRNSGDSDSDETSDDVDDAGDDSKNEFESETQNSMDDKLKKLNDVNACRPVYVESRDSDLSQVYPLELIRDDFRVKTRELVSEGHSQEILKARMDFDNFLNSIKRDVAFMAQQFEMRKSADLDRRSRIAKTGILDTNNLHNYKLTDDLFLSHTVTPEGKSHGMVLLLDWSGSMSDILVPTIKQLIVLTQFCRKISIPFDVYTFTSLGYGHLESDKDSVELESLLDKVVLEGMRICNVLSSSSHKRQIDDDMFHLYCQAQKLSHNYKFGLTPSIEALELGGTPLNNALFQVPGMVKKLRERNHAQKVSFVCITDGESSPLYHYKRVNSRYSNQYWITGTQTHNYGKVFLRDGYKTYELEQGYQQTGSIVKVLMNRMKDVSFTHIYLAGQRGCEQYVRHITNHSVKMDDNKFRKSGADAVKTDGWPLVALVNPNNFRNPEDEIQIEAGAEKGKIRAALRKMLRTKSQSKVVLTQLVSNFS